MSDLNAFEMFQSGRQMANQEMDANTERQRRRGEMQYRKQIMDSHLQTMQRKEAAGIPQMEVDNTALELKQVRHQLLKRDTFDAFDAYLSDGNVDHLNRLYGSNPLMQEMSPNVSRYDQLSLDNQSDLAMLKEQGVTPEQLQNIDMDAFRKRFVKITTKDGKQKIADIQLAMGMTGFTQQKSKEAAEAALSKLKLDKAQAEVNVKNAQADMFDRKGTGAWIGSTGATSTADVRNADAVGEARARVNSGQGTPADEALLELHTEKVTGNTPGKAREADTTVKNLYAEFGGEQGYFQTDFTKDSAARRRAAGPILKLEQLTDTKLTNADKDKLDDIRQLIGLGNPAGQLTNDQVGLIDSLVTDVKKYVSNNPEGIDATSAYNAYRNSIRNALYGATLTQGEIDAFNSAFGSSHQQLGPVLQQLQTGLTQVQSKLESVAMNMHPAVAQYRVGMDQKKLESVMFALQQRIDMLKGIQRKSEANTPIAPSAQTGAATTNGATAKLSPAEILRQVREGK